MVMTFFRRGDGDSGLTSSRLGRSPWCPMLDTASIWHRLRS